jgi:hypothetical protein
LIATADVAVGDCGRPRRTSEGLPAIFSCQDPSVATIIQRKTGVRFSSKSRSSSRLAAGLVERATGRSGRQRLLSGNPIHAAVVVLTKPGCKQIRVTLLSNGDAEIFSEQRCAMVSASGPIYVATRPAPPSLPRALPSQPDKEVQKIGHSNDRAVNWRMSAQSEEGSECSSAP